MTSLYLADSIRPATNDKPYLARSGGCMKAAILCIGVLLAAGACKKTGTGGGGGGGGGGWLVGSDGMMLNVQSNGAASGYDAASKETLNGIACRYSGEAWVAGTHGTLLYTDDAGASWQPQSIPTTAD